MDYLVFCVTSVSSLFMFHRSNDYVNVNSFHPCLEFYRVSTRSETIFFIPKNKNVGRTALMLRLITTDVKTNYDWKV